MKRFFLKSFLFICLGLTIATIAFAAHFDISSPPGRPNIFDIESHGCKISFKKPVYDGGTPIIKYIVQGMDRETGRWVQKNTTVPLQCTIDGVDEKSQWKFRIMALNAAGLSNPSVDSDFVTFKNPFR